MNLLGAVIIVSLALLGIFAVANWSVLTTPTLLSFIAFDVQGPLGVILLGVTLAMVALFALYVLSLRTTMLMESRQHKRELAQQRSLAESAEASRLNALRVQMEREFAQVHSAIEQTGGRIENVQQALRGAFDETANGLAANLGEVEDKLDRVLAQHGGPAGPS